MAKLRHIAMVVEEMEKTAQFYEKSFGMQRVRQTDTAIGLSDGVVSLVIIHPSNVNMKGDSRSQRRCPPRRNHPLRTRDRDRAQISRSKRASVRPDQSRIRARFLAHCGVERSGGGHQTPNEPGPANPAGPICSAENTGVRQIGRSGDREIVSGGFPLPLSRPAALTEFLALMPSRPHENGLAHLSWPRFGAILRRQSNLTLKSRATGGNRQ